MSPIPNVPSLRPSSSTSLLYISWWPFCFRQNLLEDVDALSLAETCSLPDTELYSIDEPSRNYYTDCFERLYRVSTRYTGPSKEQIYTGALEGAHPEVKKFFENSKLDREELSQMWRLVDLNQDGYLNLDEFCIAMHLIVLRVKGDIRLPQTLPANLRPAVITPPRVSQDVTPVAASMQVCFAIFVLFVLDSFLLLFCSSGFFRCE